MFVSRGLVGPKMCRNSSTPKGKQVNIPVPVSSLTLLAMNRRAVALFKPYKRVEYRNGEKHAKG